MSDNEQSPIPPPPPPPQDPVSRYQTARAERSVPAHNVPSDVNKNYSDVPSSSSKPPEPAPQGPFQTNLPAEYTTICLEIVPHQPDVQPSFSPTRKGRRGHSRSNVAETGANLQPTYYYMPRRAAELSPVLRGQMNAMVANINLRPIPTELQVVGQQCNQAILLTVDDRNCPTRIIEKLIAWCIYHANDVDFEITCRVDDFDEDEYERTAARRQEPPNYWDWTFLVEIAGEPIDPEKRGDFYDLMIAAHFLGLVGLVETGGKYLCRQISGLSVREVRYLLGIVPDLSVEEERRIQQTNSQLLTRH